VTLGESLRNPSPSTLDDLFRRAVQRRPGAAALIDPPDRENFTDGTPKRLSYAEADRVVSAIADRLRSFNLPTQTVVALQLPNTVESVLALLGVVRAGLIAMPIPLLWRHAELVAALSRVTARALIFCRRIGATDYGDLAIHVAAETFAIRFLAGFGTKLPDGVVAFSDLFDQAAVEPKADQSGHSADHIAVVTWDVTAEGRVATARSHSELLAAGSAIVSEARIDGEPIILGSLTTSSLAGLASTIVPWLVLGGTLVLHHPFAPHVFAAQRTSQRATIVVVPGMLALPAIEGPAAAGRYGLQTVIGVWRAPERLNGSAPWPAKGTQLVDVSVFGEIGLVARRRGADGRPVMIVPASTAGKLGPTGSPEIKRTQAGTIGLRGAMVPARAFPPGSERSDSCRLGAGQDGFVDTGYVCRVDRQSGMLVVDAPPPGLACIGGYRFILRELQELVSQIDAGSSLTALPDLLTGHRLAGVAGNREGLCRALIAHGVNPLIVAAFRGRRGERASAA